MTSDWEGEGGQKKERRLHCGGGEDGKSKGKGGEKGIIKQRTANRNTGRSEGIRKRGGGGQTKREEDMEKNTVRTLKA